MVQVEMDDPIKLAAIIRKLPIIKVVPLKWRVDEIRNPRSYKNDQLQIFKT